MRAGTLVLIGQSLSGRVLQSRPRSSTSSSSAPFPLPLLLLTLPFLLFLKLRPGEKWRRVCRLIDPNPPGHLHPMRSRFFCRHRGCEGRAASRPIGANFFLARPPKPPHQPSTQPQEKVRLCRQAPLGGWLGNGVKMVILGLANFVNFLEKCKMSEFNAGEQNVFGLERN